MLAKQLGRSRHLHSVHLFNPGGLPDLHRYMSLHSAFGAGSTLCELQVHRIAGDTISLGFLPIDQKTYGRTRGLENADSHKLQHFLRKEPRPG